MLPFDLSSEFDSPLARILWRMMAGPLGLKTIQRLYNEMDPSRREAEYFSECLRVMDTGWRDADKQPGAVPRSGPVVVVANHPFGAVEAMVLGDLLSKARPDFKFLGNFLLHRFPELRKSVIPVDPFGRSGSARANVRGMAESVRWLREGHVLAVFPAGEVARFDFRRRVITDPAWSEHVAALVRRTKATVVPAYFPGHNSLTFNLLGMLHPRLRTLMLARELLARRGKTLKVYVGKPINFSRLESFATDRGMISYLRSCTYLLGKSKKIPVARRLAAPLLAHRSKQHPPVIHPVPAPRIEHELHSLPADCLLAGEKGFEVWLAGAGQIPETMLELGRLRELTFRAVGEGTGKVLDLDRFDRYYRHILLWDSKGRKLAGAYRLGPADEIIESQGVEGLYTSTLFHYRDGLLDTLRGSVELGRSFITEEYQRNPSCLMLLWKGIGAFLVRNPRYRVLFGPVSISGDYNQLSRRLIVRYLRNHCSDPELGRLVKPRKPYRMFPFVRSEYGRVAAGLSDIEDVGLMVSMIESDGKGVPVLLRHYLRLNATILSFNLDKDFSNVLDGLIFVDMRRTDRKYLTRFLGREGLESFLAAQGISERKPETELSAPV